MNRGPLYSHIGSSNSNHYYNSNGGTKICYLLIAGHSYGIFVDGWMCMVQFRSHGSDIGHVILIVVT